MPRIEPLGDRALLASFETEQAAASWAAAVRAQKWPAILDVVPAYRSVAVFPEPETVNWNALCRHLSLLEAGAGEAAIGRSIELPVLYDGIDLPDVARHARLSPAAVVEAHTAQQYTVFAVGFLPGFPYAGYLPESLAGQPRRASPRKRVRAGSVAIAGRQTGVYPIDSPGGWNILGRTPLRIVDLDSGHFPIRAGDRLRFVPITATEYEQRFGEWLR
ncbi:MAG: 5-oxoprolinase subunit PxpB [Isosphaeraceae bacterium]|nr:5-oxoprolinase subunit PxpB [Isosphaeraceae bacterium]